MRTGVLLAAGASRRMGRPKALVVQGKESYLTRGVRHLWTACDHVVVVLGSRAKQIQSAAEAEFERLVSAGWLHGELARAQVHGHGSDGLEVQFVTNPRWATGMFGSVCLGLSEALELRPSSILVLPVDHPAIKPATVTELATAMDAALAAYEPKPKKKKGSGGSAVAKEGFAYALVPRHKRQGGHPIALSPTLARAVAKDTKAATLSEALRRNARLIGFLETSDKGVVRNRNTPDD